MNLGSGGGDLRSQISDLREETKKQPQRCKGCKERKERVRESGVGNRQSEEATGDRRGIGENTGWTDETD